MAGTLAEMSRMALAHDFRHIDPTSARILLYEAGARILPTYPEDLSIKAQQHLKSLGVEVYTNARVTSVDSKGIVVGGQTIQAGTVLWGAGVVASPAGRWLDVTTDGSGRIMVGPDLSIPGYTEVFGIGDTAFVVAPVRHLLGIKSKTPMTMPGVAQAAIQEGKYVAHLIRCRVTGQGEPEPFWYWDKGDLAIVGRTYAVADLRFAKFAGFPAWVRAHLLSRWICQSTLRVAAMGTCVSDETSASASLAGGVHRHRNSSIRPLETPTKAPTGVGNRVYGADTFQQVDGVPVSITPADLLGQTPALFGTTTRTGKSDTTTIVLETISNCGGNQGRYASGESYSIRMASMRTKTPKTRENGGRDVAKVAPDQPETNGSLPPISDTEPLGCIWSDCAMRRSKGQFTRRRRV
jgi:hypothetical protein